MKRSVGLIILGIGFLLLLIAGCKKQEGNHANHVELTKEPPEHTAAGIVWSYPSRWKKEGARPMRVATYSIPAAEGESESGECAVFYFGSGQGGDIDMNIQRWGSQFENAGQAVKTTSQANGMNVTRVQISGTYLAPAGPMMESQGKKENYRLLGAIVEAPEGMVFFKFTGPSKTIAAAEGEFDAMVGSVAKE